MKRFPGTAHALEAAMPVEARDGLFIGSISPEVTTDAAGAAELFTEAARSFRLPAVPLGETDDPNWVLEQLGALEAVPALRRLRRGNAARTGNYTGITTYVRRRGHHVDPGDLDLRIATRVDAGFPVLREVAERQGVPVPRLQVGVNTLDLAVFGLGFGVRSELGAFVEATRRETLAAWERTGGNVFFLVETPVAIVLANLARGHGGVLNWLAGALERVVGALPAGAPWGFHFCYGDLGNNSIGDHGAVAERLGLHRLLYRPAHSVRMIGTVLRRLAESGHVSELVHVPLALGKRPPSLASEDYEAYRAMVVPEETKVFAGAIHHGRSTEELVALYRVLDDVFGRRVGMANSCGLGRHSADQVHVCLGHMRALAHS
ncbi:hypothetical protein [Lentzea sp. NPDC060358]|uniref:hypothetical protein n=1 Tax=Lentzea sp. NPDC060358 TaxID=3347103 RepID=UPI00365C6B67